MKLIFIALAVALTASLAFAGEISMFTCVKLPNSKMGYVRSVVIHDKSVGNDWVLVDVGNADPLSLDTAWVDQLETIPCSVMLRNFSEYGKRRIEEMLENR